MTQGYALGCNRRRFAAISCFELFCFELLRFLSAEARSLPYAAAFIFSAACERFFDRALHVESLLGDVVVLAFDDSLEAFYGVGDFHVTAGGTGELLGDVEGLRQEALHFAGAGYGQFLVFAQFVDTENRDDVLQIFIGLQGALHRLRDVVVFLADDSRVEHA